jgi:hypothetical protein
VLPVVHGGNGCEGTQKGGRQHNAHRLAARCAILCLPNHTHIAISIDHYSLSESGSLCLRKRCLLNADGKNSDPSMDAAVPVSSICQLRVSRSEQGVNLMTIQVPSSRVNTITASFSYCSLCQGLRCLREGLSTLVLICP